ncbi:hypothetical protein OP10G_3423 [Fimbriimonas ginsengisoli Gsoil 348]|uniref:Uncharacterized protein n=1 Tax=Fimbriimonas ginsengisoli Gsoil 348 TaxID=661478 RepID=A0A068NTL9_FIMGI|nr:hypothetical protein OP10G_3423 [Fimbriimonas ginsengisoli Gsoil 348]
MLALFCLGGCGASTPTAPPHKAPEGQFFRFVNATADNLVIAFDKLPVQNPYTPAYSPCSFRKGAPREHHVTISSEDGKVMSEKVVKFTPGALVTYVVTKSGGNVEMTPFDGERRSNPANGSELRVIGTAEDLSIPLSLREAGSKTAQPLKPAVNQIKSGSYDVVVGDKILAKAEMEPRIAYSVLVFKHGAKPDVLILRNSPEPMQMASADVSKSGG